MSGTINGTETPGVRYGNEDNGVGESTAGKVPLNSDGKREGPDAEKEVTPTTSEIESGSSDAGTSTEAPPRSDYQAESHNGQGTMPGTSSDPPNQPVRQESTEETPSSPANPKPPPNRQGSPIDYQREWLDLSRLVIESKQVKKYARALESKKLTKLKTLILDSNRGDLGMRAMLNAMLEESCLKELEKLILWNVSSYDQITNAEEGTEIIASALVNNKMPHLHTLDLTSSLPKLIGPRTYSKVFKDLKKCSFGEGRLSRCKRICCDCFTCCSCADISPNANESCTLACLNCHMFNNILTGDDGCIKIMEALEKSRPPLVLLNLRDNYIGERGVKSVASLLQKGVLSELSEVNLQNNPVGLKGARGIVTAYLENPLLTASIMLDWPDPVLKERATALRDKNIRLEHRLEDLDGITMDHGRISRSFKWHPEHRVERPSKPKDHYRFHLECQHPDHGKNSSQSSADTQDTSSSPPSPPPPEGIRMRRTFDRRRPPNYVDREYKEAGENGAAPPAPGATSEVQSVKVVSQMCITVPPWGFAALTAAVGSETLWKRFKSLVLNVLLLPKEEKKESLIKAIIMELLMLADRKPREFKQMFGLTRRLLKDEEEQHYPAYVCDTCKAETESVVQKQFLEHNLSKPAIDPGQDQSRSTKSGCCFS